jgi:hypothetical protein
VQIGDVFQARPFALLGEGGLHLGDGGGPVGRVRQQGGGVAEVLVLGGEMNSSNWGWEMMARSCRPTARIFASIWCKTGRCVK